MDKITCLSFILYQSTNNPFIKEQAIQLLNGDVSLHDLKKNELITSALTSAESLLKTKQLNKSLVQDFASQFLLTEV